MVGYTPVDYDPFGDPAAASDPSAGGDPLAGLRSAMAGVGNWGSAIASGAMRGAREGWGDQPLVPPRMPDESYLGTLQRVLGTDVSAAGRAFQAGQGAVAGAFAGAGMPLLGRDIAAMPEAFVGGEIPHYAAPAVAGTAAAARGAAPAMGRLLADESGELRIPPVGPGLETPIGDTLKAGDLADQLRDMHLARGDDGLPLTRKGSTPAAITPPAHIQTMEDFNGLVGRYADLAQQRAVGRDWYRDSGKAVLANAGFPEAADRFAAALAETSRATNVAGNAAEAVKAWNQAMAGDPQILAGRFPNQMGAWLQSYLYGGEPVTGEKIGPFNAAVGAEWNPDFDHAFVNDIWNMRALEYPPSAGKVKDAAYYTGSPTLGQHNFARIVADRASDILGERTGLDWQPQQTQAAAWTGIKSKLEGANPGDTAFNFADALRQRYAQQSWESAPGETTNNMPEFHQADPIDQQAYHNAIRGVLEDDQGRDIINRHFGLLTGPSFEGPGVFQGVVRPGSQAQAATGMMPGGYLQGVDPASRDLLNAAEATRGLLLRQDAAAWHQPVFRPGLKPGDSNLADIDIGRSLTTSEAQAATEAMAKAAGSDFFSPIATENGFRFLNVPDVSGVKNVDFQKAVAKALEDDRLPDATVRPAYADSGYLANDWREDPGGQSYLRAISGTGRPDVERRAAQLLATLGPRISEIEDQFAGTHGWTPDQSTRIWETSPQIQRYATPLIPQGAFMPSPPRPWATGPGPAPGTQSPLTPVDLAEPAAHEPIAGPGDYSDEELRAAGYDPAAWRAEVARQSAARGGQSTLTRYEGPLRPRYGFGAGAGSGADEEAAIAREVAAGYDEAATRAMRAAGLSWDDIHARDRAADEVRRQYLTLHGRPAFGIAGAIGGAAAAGAPQLIPVDHDPFAEAAD